ncbi:MAG: hypothetical protein GY953_41215, partial [bacterium]|nr:hypothetical protein [bacterium]
MESRSGELVLRGAGAAPVIVAPDEPSIDWSRYETILIRMRSERGGALGLKIGDLELSKTAAAGRFQVHRFDLNITDSSFRQPLAIMPAGVASSVTIDSVELVPREVAFTAAA